MAKTNQNSTPMFGEKSPDFLDGYTLPVERTSKYESARKAAIDAIQKFGLQESDFWIKKVLGWKKDKIVYTNLILSYSACLKINAKMPANRQFDPECVDQGSGADGGVLFLYRSKEQGVFVTGEASRFNVGNCPYPGASAEKRLFCRVVTRLSGLYEEGIYSEVESEDFRAPAGQGQNQAKAPTPQAPQIGTQAPAQASVAPQPQAKPSTAAKSDKLRVAKLAEAIAKTKTDLDTLLGYYGVENLQDLSDDNLAHCERIIFGRMKDMPEEEQAQPEMSLAAQLVLGSAPKAASEPEMASMPEAEEESAPDNETAAGDVIYMCVDTAPKSFQGLNGKTLDEIGVKMLKALYGRKNSVGKQYVSDELNAAITAYLTA